jgi:hypothetical protein
MKRYFSPLITLFILVVISSCSSFQVGSPEERSVQYIHELTLDKNEIFGKSIVWLAKVFVDSKEVLEVKDKEAGNIVGKGTVTFLNVLVDIPCRFTFVMEIKDNKYRITYSDFTGMWGELHNMPRPLEKTYIEQIKTKIAILDNDLFNFLIETKSTESW